jgi:hypothetical protein
VYDILKASGLVFEMVNGLEIHIVCCVAIVGILAFSLRLWTAGLSIGESMDKLASIHNVNNSNTLISLLNSGRLIVGDLLGSLPSVKAQIRRRCTFDRFTGSYLFYQLERMPPLAQATKIQPLEPDSMRNGICYADLCPLVIPCFQRNNGSCCPHLIPSQKSGKLVFMLRFANIAKARWHCCMLNQFHQHDHSKQTVPTDRVARVSILGLNNVRDTFVTGFHELKTVIKVYLMAWIGKRRKVLRANTK